MKKAPEVVFSADGIRGIVGQWPVTVHGFQVIGAALRKYILKMSEGKAARVVIGRDTRPSGVKLVRALKTSIGCGQITVVDLGIATTPLVGYFARKMHAQLGVAVTASHNPIAYNGIKLLDGTGFRIDAGIEKRIAKVAARIDLGHLSLCEARHSINTRQLLQEYIDDQIDLSGISSIDKLRLVIDCADGSIARILPALFNRLGATENVILLNTRCRLSAHKNAAGSEFVRNKPAAFAEIVRKTQSSCGFAFDGDGDRLIAVDVSGKLYDGDDFLFILARHLSQSGLLKGNSVVTSVAANGALDSVLSDYGISTIRTTNGDKNLEHEIKDGDFLLGCEPVGNIILNDAHHGSADPLFGLLIILKIMQSCGEDAGELGSLVSGFHKYPYVSLRKWLPNLPELNAVPGLEELRHAMLSHLGDNARILYWKSTTEPGLVNVIVEARDAHNITVVQQVAEHICEYLAAAT